MDEMHMDMKLKKDNGWNAYGHEIQQRQWMKCRLRKQDVSKIGWELISIWHTQSLEEVSICLSEDFNYA